MQTLTVAFLSTSLQMGRMIRTVTRHPYNHVALSLSPELDEMYSFARPYRDMPLCGAFVRETPERYLWERGEVRVKRCAIPMTALQEKKVRYTLHYFEAHANETVYNHFAALLDPLQKPLFLRGAYTCVQFVQAVLGHYFPETGVKENAYLSLSDLEEILFPYAVWEGRFSAGEKKCRFDYYTPHGGAEKCRETLKTAGRLFCRLLEKS